ncbi:hypothetical protein BGX21_006964 [Mortierella sp. AD011]|nr:hypothetical protein BGX20_002951 [Mortierella sp. AD010]KAF9403105.1 hypothetical protein BGX21_006964 [Mortierella sp. AD011]
MTSIPPQPANPPPLPSSEQEFTKTLLSIRYRQRSTYIQSLTATHQEALIPLLRELLETKPAVLSIPIPRPAKNETDLNADGGNPAPEIDVVPLTSPQSNAASRYIQREAGVSMAIILAQKGSKQTMSLLLDNFNHPYQVGKKRLIACIALCANDEDILAVVTHSPLAVRDALVAALTKEHRKDLANQILGKPRRMAVDKIRVPDTTRFRLELEKAKEYDRERIWRSYSTIIDVSNKPGKNACEENESIKDVVLTLQETYPPLYPWTASLPDKRSPKLASLIEDSLLSFLKYDAPRTIRILQATSVEATDVNKHNVHIPSTLIETKRARAFWSHHDADGALMKEYWLSLIAVNNGEFLKKDILPHATLFSCCRGPVVAQLVRAALDLVAGDEFKTLSKADPEAQTLHLENLLKFAVKGVKNLIHRVSGCSAHKDRIVSTETLHKSLQGLIQLLCSSAMASWRVQFKDDESFISRLYRHVLKPLLKGGKAYSHPSKMRSFPPLGEHLFQQIRSVFKSKSRKDQSVLCLVEDLMAIVAPRNMSVYDIPDNGYEQPFSSVPAWDNDSVFNTCVADCLNRTGKAMIQLDSIWINHFCKLSPTLKQPQRDQVVQWIIALPSFKTLINNDEGVSVFPMLEALCTNIDLRHQIVFPLVFSDKKDKEINLGDRISEWAPYVDIRIPDVRALLVKETIKPAFEDRLKWISAIINSTRLVGDVKEWIITLKWLLPKTRNEIQPNLMLLSPHLLPSDSKVPRQYLDNATLEEATELAALYLAMDSQNAAAVTPVSGIVHFLNVVSSEALKRFANSPSHPFYHLGCEIPWRRKLTECGEMTALSTYTLAIYPPSHSRLLSERSEEAEILRRKVMAKEKETMKTEGGPWGRYLIAEGEEETFVQGKLKAYHSRWLSVKAVMNPDVEGEDLAAFKKAQGSIWRSICLSLHNELGWRWKHSPTLVTNLSETIELLAQAPTKTIGSDVVLDWSDDFRLTKTTLNESSSYVQSVRDIYTDEDWLRENRDKMPWYSRFRDLRLDSTEYKKEIQIRVNECVLKNGKRDHIQYEALMTELLNKSPSAIHIHEVNQFVSDEGSYLLTDEQLGLTKGIRGLFNQVETPDPYNFFVSKPSRLNPHQCEVLKARHLNGMVDTATPFTTRVQHAEAFVSIPTTTVEEVANVLCTPSLPSRIAEALLMFLPTLGEPASTLQILMAPVYIQSHLARTSIHAVDNALKCVHIKQIPDFILPLFPPPGERQQKVTVQKEGIRLACASMTLLSDPKIRSLIEDLLSRGTRSELHNDVLVVILQSLLGLLCGPEGREERYQDITNWIWKSLTEVAHSDAHKKSGVALVLLAVTPSYRTPAKAPRVNTNYLQCPARWNATLNDLAKVRVPEGLVNRYVDDLILPMCVEPTGENENDEDLIEVRVQAIQLLIQSDGWVTSGNASKLAKDWRRSSVQVPLDEDRFQLWSMFALGIGRCVGPEAEGALANGQEGNDSWQELIGLIQDQVDAFLDKTQRRVLRQKALERIHSLSLSCDFLLQNFEDAQKSGAFKGGNLDLCRPLLGKAIESVTWEIALEREITVFKIYEGMPQDEIDKEVLRLLLRIADYSGRYLSSGYDVSSWVVNTLAKKSSHNVNLKRIIGPALFKPHEELVDWVHLDEVSLSLASSSKSVFSLSEISTLVERLANQDNASFYWTNRMRVWNILKAEVAQLILNNHGQLKGDTQASFTQVMAPIVKRAKAVGWAKGPDSTIVTNMMDTQMDLMCLSFPTEVGSLLHYNIIQGVDSGNPNNRVILESLYKFTDFGSQAIAMESTSVAQHGTPSSGFGMSPSSAMIMEAYMNGTLDELDLTPLLEDHSLPLDIMYGGGFAFKDSLEMSKIGTQRYGIPLTLKEVDARWNKIMSDYGGYFKPLQQAVKRAPQKNLSPLILQAYRDHATSTLSRFSKFVLMRPFVYIEFMRLALTAPAPGTTFTVDIASSQMADAFAPYRHETEDEFTYAWAPPLCLALDLAEYLLHVVREEAATEGQREAQLIEKTTALFLKKWITQTVKTTAGKHLAEAEDVKALEARYLALVEELCEDGSGGQSEALQLGDFLPGNLDVSNNLDAPIWSDRSDAPDWADETTPFEWTS